MLKIRKFIKIFLINIFLLSSAQIIWAGGEVTISHYFSGELGKANFMKGVKEFESSSGIKMKDSPVGHEDFKTDILVRAAGKNLPDVFSYWAGARVQFIVDSNSLLPIDDMWKRDGLDMVVAKSVANSATMYNGKRYLVPLNYHYSGMFYNKSVLSKAGINTMPSTWDEFLSLCAKLKSKGITPIALGSKNRWPAQFWFDYLILRTVGPDYRHNLMTGKAAYDDYAVKHAMSIWKDLVDKGYFTNNSNADTWTDASDKVARGKAAMTLMGTWITGYWNGMDLKPGVDYDFFPFPIMSSGIPNAVVGPVDGLVVSANAKNPSCAKKFLSFMMSNPEVQAQWTDGQGALSANTKVDPTKYNTVMQRALRTVAKAEVYVFNYDLATPPPVAEVGLSMFSEFMDNPANYISILSNAQKNASREFKN